MKIYKITEASEYLGVSINTLKTLANKVKTGRCARGSRLTMTYSLMTGTYYLLPC